MATILSRSSTSCLKVGLWEGTACQQSLIIMYLPGQGEVGAQPRGSAWGPPPTTGAEKHQECVPVRRMGPTGHGDAAPGIEGDPPVEGRETLPPALMSKGCPGRRMDTAWAGPCAGVTPGFPSVQGGADYCKSDGFAGLGTCGTVTPNICLSPSVPSPCSGPGNGTQRHQTPLPHPSPALTARWCSCWACPSCDLPSAA